MTDHRIEAAAKAMSPTGVRDEVRDSQWAWPPYAASQARNMLAAADEADRAAGICRIDVNDPQLRDKIARALFDSSETFRGVPPVGDNSWHHIKAAGARHVTRCFTSADIVLAVLAGTKEDEQR